MKNRVREVQFDYLEFLFKGMFSVKSKNYPNSTFFKKDDKVILELEKSGTLWVLYSVWGNISDMFSYEYEETQQLIKEWVEAQLKQEVVTPRAQHTCSFQLVESQLKKEEVTPKNAIAPPYSWRNLKQEEVTPKEALPPYSWTNLKSEEIKPTISTSYRLEEKLKSEEIKPVKFYETELQFLEEQLKQEILKLSKDEKK
jgi:hypothetical protein